MMRSGVLFILAYVFFATGWVSPARADDELAAGKILVADRKLKDPNFERAVIYLITYDEQGAVGLILNRETDTPVGKVLSGVKEAASRKDFAFSGGPVEMDSILALYRTTGTRKGAQRVSPGISAILDETALKETLAAGGDSSALRFYVGYAGWGPGQLDLEVDAGAWYVTGGDTTTVFDPDPDTLWDRLIRRKDALVARRSAEGIFRVSLSTRDLLTFKADLAHGTKLHPAHGIAGNLPAVRGFQLSL